MCAVAPESMYQSPPPTELLGDGAECWAARRVGSHGTGTGGGRAITTEGRRRKEGAVAGASRLEGRADERLVASGESLLIVRRPPGVLGPLLLQAAATAATPVASTPSPVRVLRGRRWWRQRVTPGGCGRTRLDRRSR